MQSSPGTSSFVRRRSAISVVGLIGLFGCWLPISYVEATSPALVGQYRRFDGTPAAGRTIAVSTADGDSYCAHALASGLTDSTGRIALPASATRHRGIWVVPAIERFGLNYHLCVGVADGSLRSAFDGIWSLNPKAPPDTLSCVEGQTAEVTCTARGRRYAERTARPNDR